MANEGIGRESFPDDKFFRPANERHEQDRGTESARPTADLAATAHHNDKLPEAIPELGTPPSQDNPDNQNPKPILKPDPKYTAGFQMNQNVAPHPDEPVGVPVRSVGDVPVESSEEVEGPEVLEE